MVEESTDYGRLVNQRQRETDLTDLERNENLKRFISFYFLTYFLKEECS